MTALLVAPLAESARPPGFGREFQIGVGESVTLTDLPFSAELLRVDALIVQTIPDVRKAVRWNAPFYGAEGRGWFLCFSCATKYVKVAFLNGSQLNPVPPIASRDANTRYLHLIEAQPLDEARLADWLRQAARLPGASVF